jgi:autocrine motility factor receptor
MMFVFGKIIARIFFGKLRSVESKNIQDRILHFVLYKTMFAGAILEGQFKELLVWIGWFSILGFLKIFSFLTRDRFEYVSTSYSLSFPSSIPSIPFIL